MKTMTKRVLSVALAAMIGVAQWGQAAETGPVAEVFGCTYIGDSTMADIDGATEFFKQTIAELNNPALNALSAYIWTPFRAQTDADVLWFSVHENLNAFGAVSDVMAGPEGSAVTARYFEHVDCGSGIYEMTQLYASETVEYTQPTVIDAYRCNLHEGKTMADVQATVAAWQSYVEGQGGWDNALVMMMTPIASASDYDVYYFGVHESASAYAARITADRTTPEGQAMGAKWDDLQRCEATTWIGRNVIQGAM
jgi:hypothetical protein